MLLILNMFFWLSYYIDSRRRYFAAILMYKIMRMGQPTYLKNIFTMYTHDRPVRGEINLSFQFQYAKFWNALPFSLRFLPSLSRFKKAIRQYLFELDAQPLASLWYILARKETHTHTHTYTPFNPSSLTVLLAPSDCDFVNDVN